MIDKLQLYLFIKESNKIEGINRNPTDMEINATRDFLELDRPGVIDMQALVSVYQPNAELRHLIGMDVRIGGYFPPPGGPKIRGRLTLLLNDVYNEVVSPYEAHISYESLHPFMDGNGRSGRALWLWQMNKKFDIPLGFLHHWYYQSLQE